MTDFQNFGYQNNSDKNLNLSNGNTKLTYTIRQGDSLDGDIANFIGEFGTPDLQNKYIVNTK